MKYSVGDIIVKKSLTFGQQLVLVQSKTDNVHRTGEAGFNGVHVDKEGNQVRLNDPYGNKVWGFNREAITIHKKA